MKNIKNLMSTLIYSDKTAIIPITSSLDLNPMIILTGETCVGQSDGSFTFLEQSDDYKSYATLDYRIFDHSLL